MTKNKNDTRTQYLPQPILMLVAECTDQELADPFSGKPLSKQVLGQAVVAIDVIVIICFIIFIQIMESAQEKITHKFKDQTIEMTDFTVRVKNLPEDIKYGGNIDHLRAYLIHHFERIIKDQMKLRDMEVPGETDFTDIAKASENPQNGDKPSSKLWEIADINFGSSTMKETEYLSGLADIRTEFITNKVRLQHAKEQKDIDKINEEQGMLQTKFKFKYEEYMEVFPKDRKAIEIADNETSLRFAYVTFRQMDALDHIRNAYTVGKCDYFWTMRCGQFCCADKKKAMLAKHFFKKWPKVTVACEPDNIKW